MIPARRGSAADFAPEREGRAGLAWRSPRLAVWPLAVAETVSWGLLYYTFGVLLAPMAARVRASEAEVAGAFSLALLAGGLAAPLVGRIVDRRGAGRVLVAGSVLGAAGFALLGQVRTPAQLHAVWILLGLAHACTSYDPAFTAIARWFDDERGRRRGWLILTCFAGFASTIFVPLAAWLVPSVGLTRATGVFAALLAGLVTPLHVLVARVHETPRAPAAPARPAAAARGAMVTLTVVLAVQALAVMSAVSFLFPSLEARGVGGPQAARLVGLVGAAQVGARLLYEPLCRAVGPRARMTLLLLVQGGSIVGWATAGGAARVVALAIFGGANGLSTIERASVIGDWFGVEGYGQRNGIIAAASAIVRSAAPVSVAFVAARASYAHAFVGLALALLLAALLQAIGEGARPRGPEARPGPR